MTKCYKMNMDHPKSSHPLLGTRLKAAYLPKSASNRTEMRLPIASKRQEGKGGMGGARVKRNNDVCAHISQSLNHRPQKTLVAARHDVGCMEGVVTLMQSL